VSRTVSLCAGFGLCLATGAAVAVDAGSVPVSSDVPEATGWRAEVVVDGLSHPWSIAWLPDGAALSLPVSRMQTVRRSPVADSMVGSCATPR
jgi:glucose/arabinose dehydrogenase